MILITGGLGFVGNELVRQLIAEDDLVVVDNRLRCAPRIEDIESIRVVQVDITLADEVRAAFRTYRPTAVFHLAAIHFIPECNANPARTLRVNVEGTQNILDAAAEVGVQHVVAVSSGAVYADAAAPLAETSAVFPSDIYGVSKYAMEQVARLWHEQTKIPVSLCRLFNVYGPRETNLHILPEIVMQLRNGASCVRLGNVSTVRDFVHSREAAEAFIRLGRLIPSGVRVTNVGTGTGYTMQQAVDMISRHIGREIRIDVDPKRLRRVDKAVQVADMKFLEQTLGWKPTVTLERGLHDLLRFEGLV